jgi:hypothetical protein
MYRRDGETITLTMTVDQYAWLMMALGYALGWAGRTAGHDLTAGFLLLSNALNEGHPQYTPYEVPTV